MGERLFRRISALVLAGLALAIAGCGGGGGSASGGVITGFQALGGPGPGAGVGQFNQPNEIAFNATGTKAYFTDGLNNRLVEVDVSANLNTSGWTTFGSNGSGVGQFGGSGGRIADVAVDSSGRIYITDPGNNRIVRIDNMTGAGWTTFGTAGTGVGQFTLVTGIALDSTGRIYVVDESANRVVRIDDMTGAGWVELGILAGGNGVGQFSGPSSIAIRNTGSGEKIYVVDRNNNRIVQMDDMSGGGWAVFSLGIQISDQPGGVSVDSSGRIYFTQFFRNRIARIDNISGANIRFFGSAGSASNQLQNPVGTSIDSSNRIYISDRGNNRIVRIDTFP